MECKFCKSSNTIVVKRINSLVNQYHYSLYHCKECKSRFFDYNEHPEELQSMYNDLSSRDVFPLEFKPSMKWLNEKRTIISLLKREPESLLDVGCRTGDFLMHFNGNALIEGVELSQKFALTARERGIKIYNDFIENIRFERKYDVVSCYAVLEHLNNPFTFIDKFEAIINHGGLLVIMIPTHQSLKESFIKLFSKGVWHMYSPPEHLNFYSRKFIDSYLEKKGFVVVKRCYSSGGMTFSSKKHPILNKLEITINSLVDRSLLSRLPIFDHMYTYYKLT